ncbi:MAG: YbhN family protein [Planctomycetota bacterium]
MPPSEPVRRAPPTSSVFPRKLARRLLVLVLCALLVYAAFAFWADFSAVRQSLANFPWVLVPVALALSFANHAVRFLRWERYRRLLAIELDRRTSWLVYLSGFAWTVTPGKMGEAFKSWLLRRVAGTPVHKSAPIVLAERFTDLLGFLVLIAVGGIATQPESTWVFWATLALCIVLLALVSSERGRRSLLAIARRTPVVSRLAPKIEGAFASMRVLFAPSEILLPTTLAAIGWSLECTAFWLIASALAPGTVPFLFAVYTFALSAVAGAVLVLFPGGLGVTEASLGALLRGRYIRAGIPVEAAAAKAVSATLLIRLCTLWFAVLIGLLATAMFTRRFGAVEAEPAMPEGEAA